MGYLHEISRKKIFCIKKVTKLPDLTVIKDGFSVFSTNICGTSLMRTVFDPLFVTRACGRMIGICQIWQILFQPRFRYFTGYDSGIL